MKNNAGKINEYFCNKISSNRAFGFSFEIIVAIGGPKTNQQMNDKNKSFNRTKRVL